MFLRKVEKCRLWDLQIDPWVVKPYFFLYKVLFNVCVFLLLSVLIEMLDKWQNLGLKFARNKLFQISVAIVISFFL